MGVALIAKPGLNRKFSVITFGLAQVAMDIEPGIGMLTDSDILHGPSHTILGALIIAYLVTLIAPVVCKFLLSKWNKEVAFYKLSRLLQPEATSRTAVTVGAFFGTLSHVALDSLMHHDIHPLAPFSQANPLSGLISHDGVYQLCVIAGVVGAVVWLVMQWLGRAVQVAVQTVSPETLPATTHPSVWRLWVLELRSAWFWVLLMSIIPSYFFSSGLLPFVFLAFSVLLVAPATALGSLFGKFGKGKGPKAKDLRRLTIMVLVPLLCVMYVLKSDDQITTNAAPIVAAIESFRVENGQYPDKLESLTPKHLVKIPKLNYLLVQPRVTYRMTNGKPYLAISAAAGGFAHFEYDFEAKVWNHYS